MKKLNSILFILLAALIISCNSESSTEDDNSNKPTIGNQDFLKKDTIIPFSGYWINEKYYNKLIETKSPKEAQDVVNFSAIEIPKRTLINTLGIYNFHEGGEGWVIVKHGDNFQFWNADKTEKRDDIEILNNGKKIKIGADYFIRLKTSFEARKILEEVLFAGKYQMDNKILEFTENGKIIGWDEFELYEPLIDYIGTLSSADLIFLNKSTDDLSKNYMDLNTYTYRFIGDSLYIYDYKCIDYDSLNNTCNESSYGEIKFKMKKL